MTRVMTFNILIGGTSRVDQLTQMIRAGDPDIVGLVEATDDQIVQELAHNLHMHYRLSGQLNTHIWQSAVLSRLPIITAKIEESPVLTKHPLLEVTVEETNGQQLTIVVIHLTAAFSKGWRANVIRQREVQALLKAIASIQGKPHLIMGDFNAIAPGEQLQIDSLLFYMTHPDLYYQLQPDARVGPPDLNFVLPSYLHSLKPVLERVPYSRFLCSLLNSMSFFYTPRGGINVLLKAGYTDCFRLLNPQEEGFTWPAQMPSGRIDFIFASSELKHCIKKSSVVRLEVEEVSKKASDHLPVVVEFESDSLLH
jgi:endonuclease/exonuclease/phosphatase family metal-dependent hydrolase